MKYLYKTVPLELVAGVTTPNFNDHPDAFLSSDVSSRVVGDILADGYRWIRSDGLLAVFEKCVPLEPGLDFMADVRALCRVAAKSKIPELVEAAENVMLWDSEAQSPSAMGWIGKDGRP